MRDGRAGGALSIVLHTHMPYVEGYGTWPFGEEWLWEAIATCYLPLLDLLDGGAPVTVSLTPVLCDQLAREDIAPRFARFVSEVRRATHESDRDAFLAAGEGALAAQIEVSWEEYRAAASALERRGGDLRAAFAPYAAWTSAATHAVLPLVSCDELTRVQLDVGVASHRERFGAWRGGFWLPECAHAAWLDGQLADTGVRATCVELTALFGAGAGAHLTPLRSAAGPLLVPVDRATIDLVWGAGGYPAAGAYRDRHRLTPRHHRPWNNDGAPYDPAAAAALAAVHAADFVARVRARLAGAGGGLVVCALDTELLGHWWHEGVQWLGAVVAESGRQGLALLALDDALEGVDAAAAPGHLPPTSWGMHNDLSTWSTGPASEMAFALRAAELRAVAAHAGGAALRELLALQSSDWAFAVARDVAAPYGRERHALHLRELDAALAGERIAGPRSLAPGLA
ncbi:MAG TPA: 1,4-alpha-glucan branching protein domain-containing protein [Solirubrobacteraceae bacterium]|nr:1,4-alpha-glucan branching protein domain-containing protein [Solirubrobacteraceae bacterium]